MWFKALIWRSAALQVRVLGTAQMGIPESWIHAQRLAQASSNSFPRNVHASGRPCRVVAFAPEQSCGRGRRQNTRRECRDGGYRQCLARPNIRAISFTRIQTHQGPQRV
ncbi:uncharacterized protein LAESUDRAFT_721599 [Laetiporus sulphureus 93-53]|uniref:Uncharacterized protein n=1 Tax=Laetiporus sulphureus 93-53 TaxID=1314785 RepID=A0A165GF29_9APHY|nr:uncharacterized protein LAESUDRAFT_721599 [Laetiporus sulphureus 93-53]KZT10264.1 hypothetical protein LAESUDRAFT_721599 [Laetiporus sulphureus 93-53]